MILETNNKHEQNMKLDIHFSSYACAISDGSEVVLTGGFGNRRDVTAYNLDGFVEDLPLLNIGRQYHACSSFVQGSNTVRNWIISKANFECYFRYIW